MRAAPIGLAARSAGEASRHAREDALLTHFDPAAGGSSAALCAALIALIDAGDPLEAAAMETEGQARLEQAVEVARAGDRAAVAELAGGSEMGTCWTTLAAGLCALVTSRSYEEGVVWSISLGGDTDTNAAVAGALLGCRHGLAGIPARWLDPLRERERLERASDALAAARGAA